MNADRRKTLLISDLHLDPSAPGIARQFVDFLRGEARAARALYILGDLFEAWLGDDDPDPAVRSIVAELRALHDAGVPTYFMHGNRDFLVGSRFAAETGCTLLEDGTVVDLHGERVLLMHGDVLCTGDTSYQRLRRILRNPLTLFLLRHLSLESRRRLGQEIAGGQPDARGRHGGRDHGRDASGNRRLAAAGSRQHAGAWAHPPPGDSFA